MTDDPTEIYESGLSVESMLASDGWKHVLTELNHIRLLAERQVHETVHADAQIVKGAVMRWNCIEGLINELKLRLDEKVHRKNELLQELAIQPDQVDDQRIRMDIERLEPVDSDDVTY